MEEALVQFAQAALTRGESKERARAALLEAGWPADEVDEALDAYADVDFPIPVPRPRHYVSARDAFSYLVLFALLYVCSWSFGALLFQLINRAFPDPAAPYGFGYSVRAVRWSVAALLIAFPAFMWLSRRAHIAARTDPARRTSRIRKWLTYLTLFAAAGVLLGDLITLVFNVLEGELTARFFLKVIAVGVIAGAIFGYYLWDLRQDDVKPEEATARHPALRALALSIIAAVAAAVIAGVLLAGTPARARRAQLDDLRESDLQQIAAGIDQFWDDEERLPSDLEELAGTRGVVLRSLNDPVTDETYEFAPGGEDSYRLCATFALAEDEAERSPVPRRRQRFWVHPAGRHCFDIVVDRDDS